MKLKERIQTIINAVNSNDQDKLKELVHPDYIQHNPSVPTGREPFLGVIAALQKHNTKIKIVRSIQDGNDVITHTFIENAALFGAPEVVTFDIWRFNNDGMLTEHWDAMMPNTPPNTSGRTLTEGPTEVMDLDKTEENKKLIVDLFDTMINGTPEEGGAAFQKAFAMDYKQYNPNAGDGWEGFMTTQMASGSPRWVFTKQHKVLGQGNYVLSIAEGTENGIPSAYYDLVRIEDGKIVDHWDVVQAIPTEGLANQNGMFNF